MTARSLIAVLALAGTLLGGCAFLEDDDPADTAQTAPAGDVEPRGPVPPTDRGEPAVPAEGAGAVPAASGKEPFPSASAADSIPSASAADSIPSASGAAAIPSASSAEPVPSATGDRREPPANLAEALGNGGPAHRIRGAVLATGSLRAVGAQPVSGSVAVIRGGDSVAVSFASDFAAPGIEIETIVVGLGRGGSYRSDGALGVLKKATGAQFYMLPFDLDIDDFDEVYLFDRKGTRTVAVAGIERRF